MSRRIRSLKMVEPRLRAVAEWLWDEVGQPEPYPRDLLEPIIWALPAAVMEMQPLSVASAESWLRRQGAPFTFGCSDRSIRGGLISFGGKGLVLIEKADPESERRFSLAHEVSHFLLDYLLPRRRAIQFLGGSVAEVLDGYRRPSTKERVDALLVDVPVGVHTHLMKRNADGDIEQTTIMNIEGRADRLALELLAPADEVRHRVPNHGRSRIFWQTVDQTVSVLVDQFGLPQRIADAYALSLCRSWYGGPSFQEWVGFR